MILVNTCVTDVLDLEEAANDEQNFVDDPFKSHKEMRNEKLLKELDKKNESGEFFKRLHQGIGKLLDKYKVKHKAQKNADKQVLTEKEKAKLDDLIVEQKEYTYRCPVFATSMRLSESDFGSGLQNKPVFYINLKSRELPSKWVKRSVALLMEVSYQY